MNFVRSPFVLGLLYYLGVFPLEILISGGALLIYLFREEDSGIPFSAVLVVWLVVAVGSMIVRWSRKRQEPRYFEFREIVKYDLHAHQYANGKGDPCIRVTTTINSFSTTTLDDKVETVEFRIYSLLDFENFFQDVENALGRILRSIPLYKSSVMISGGDSVEQWTIPTRYRTRWGLVEVVTYSFGIEA